MMDRIKQYLKVQSFYFSLYSLGGVLAFLIFYILLLWLPEKLSLDFDVSENILLLLAVILISAVSMHFIQRKIRKDFSLLNERSSDFRDIFIRLLPLSVILMFSVLLLGLSIMLCIANSGA